MPAKTITSYICAICKSFDKNTSGSGPCQSSHIKNHCKSNHHKKNCEIFKLNLQMKALDDILIDYPEYLDNAEKFENKIKLIDQIIKDRSSVKIQTEKVETNIDMLDNLNDINFDLNVGINSREEMKNRVHSLHNFLRNNGAGYGMNALKMFNLFYGLKKIEDEENDFKIFDKTGLPNECKFSEIKKDFNENSELAFNNLTKEDGIMSNIYDNENVCKLLECNISRQIKPNTLKYLINQVDELYKIEKESKLSISR